MVSPAPLHVVEDTHRAATLLEPTRQRLLAELAEPASAIELARRTGLPRQRVGHHLRVLEREGFVRLVEERRRRNFVERILRAEARSFVIGPAALGSAATDPKRFRERFGWAYLVSLLARAIGELSVLRRRADKARKKLATLTIDAEVRFASAKHQQDFAEELSAAVAKLCAAYHDDNAEDGRTYRVIGGAYPKITKKEEE